MKGLCVGISFLTFHSSFVFKLSIDNGQLRNEIATLPLVARNDGGGSGKTGTEA